MTTIPPPPKGLPPATPAKNMAINLLRRLGPLALVLGAGFLVSEDYFERQVRVTDGKIASINQKQRNAELGASFGDWSGSPSMTGLSRLFHRGRIRFEAMAARDAAFIEGVWNTLVDNALPLGVGLTALHIGFGKEIRAILKAIGVGIGAAVKPLLPNNPNFGKAMLEGLSSGVKGGATVGIKASTGIWKAFGPIGTICLGALGFFGLQKLGSTTSGQQQREDLQNDMERLVI
jgi:hypothetical protein